MATFKLTVKCDNAAFYDREGDDGTNRAEARASEIALILHRATKAVVGNASSGALKDSNGNTVGSWSIED